MLGFIAMMRRLREGRRPKPYRITVLESELESLEAMGPLLSQIMGWKYVDARHDVRDLRSQTNVVISRSANHPCDPGVDGLTVSVDAVCDLNIRHQLKSKPVDRHWIAGRLMNELKAKSKSF